MHWYLDVLQKYAVFSGRASRTEYWMFVLINAVIGFVLSLIDLAIFGTDGILSGIYGLAVLLPSIGVSIRRLHDTNRTGWWLLIGLVPLFGWIVLLIFYIQRSDPGDNKYGPNPWGFQGGQFIPAA